MLNEKNKNFICELEKYLLKYDKIFIFESTDEISTQLLEKFCSFLKYNKFEKKIFIMSTFGYEKPEGFDFIRISDTQYNLICKMYYMYEFSGRMHIINKNYSFGSLFNYIKTGVLTEEEMFEAMLY